MILGYKVGDKVRIRKDLIEEKEYYMDDRIIHDMVTSEMYEHRGELVTIQRITTRGKYRIAEFCQDLNWVDGMFKPEKQFNSLEEQEI